MGYNVLPPTPVTGSTEIWMSPATDSKDRVDVKQRLSPSAVAKADEKAEDVKKDRQERLASLRHTESVESVDWATKYVFHSFSNSVSRIQNRNLSRRRSDAIWVLF